MLPQSHIGRELIWTGFFRAPSIPSSNPRAPRFSHTAKETNRTHASDHMSNIEQLTDLVMKQWGSKSLESLRRQAKSEATGIAFDALRVAGGKRLMLVICVTKKDAIKLLEKAFDFADNGPAEDWTTLTLLEIAMRAVAGPGFAYEGIKDQTGGFSDIILISTEPRTMGVIEQIFTMPK